LYHIWDGGGLLLLILYVDELLLTSSEKANWGNDQDDHKSIIGYVFKFITSPITWASKKQKTISLSSIDAKTKAIAKGVKQYPIFGDNQNALKKARNPTCHVNSKHVEIWHHYICEHVLLGEVNLFYVSTNDQIDDIMTKPIGKQRFQKHRDDLGVRLIASFIKN
ncbi:hypothetical protein CY35_12G104000, partial [Sphagnum magellanicum]